MSEQPISGSYRPSIMGTHGMVASGHYLATLAGARILSRGGNAVDAGVAAGLCLTVLHIDMVNLAGVAPIIVYLAEEDRVLTISGLGRWPRAASVAYFEEHCGGRIPPGVLRCITPGSPDAWITALDRYGTLSLAESWRRPCAWPPRASRCIRSWPRTCATPSGVHALAVQRGRAHAKRAPARGGRDLRPARPRAHDPPPARRRGGARQSGRRAGLGRARSLLSGRHRAGDRGLLRMQGGLLTYDDLAAFHVQVQEPVRARFHEYEIFTCGPWCQGPVLAQVLTLLEPYDLAALGHNSPAYVHLITEALKLVFADRERYYGDPEHVDVPMGALLSQSYAEARRRLIDPARAHTGMPPAGDPRRGNGAARRGAISRPAEPAAVETLDTTYVCAVDRRGNIFSATPSDGCLNAPVTPGTGLGVSSRGSQSWAVEDHPSSVAPGKRPRLTPCPAIVFKRGKPFMPLGTPGGDVQCQAMLQVFLNVAVFGMAPQAAIEAPRFATYSYPGSFEPHEYHADELRIERGLAAEVGDDLAGKGHKVVTWPDWTWKAGGVCTITIDHASGVLAAGADPRRMGYAIGW